MEKLIESKGRVFPGLVILLTIFIISSNCSKSSTDTPPATNEVIIRSMSFDPVTITISANTTITWTNKGGVAHTVTSNTGLFDSGTINNNGTWSHQFTTAGSFPYHCTIHPSMTGTVVVN